ncbi:MAG: hypothetical protein ACUZ8H_16400 [Candidatus Anammoxibacter sp.]
MVSKQYQKKPYYERTACAVALHDIRKYHNAVISKSGYGHVLSANLLNTKENRRLNRELGLRSINIMGNTNGYKKTK